MITVVAHRGPRRIVRWSNRQLKKLLQRLEHEESRPHVPRLQTAAMRAVRRHFDEYY